MDSVQLKIVIDGKEALISAQELKAALVAVGTSASTASEMLRSSGNNIVRAFENVRGVVQGVKEGMSVLQATMGESIKKFVFAEQAEMSFEVLLKSVDKAKQRMQDLSNFAAKTPFQLNEVVEASRQLEVLTKGALSTGDGLKLVGDVSAGSGVKINELSMWMGRLYDGIKNNRPVGEAMMRLQELGAVSGDTRIKIEQLEKQGNLATQGWNVMVKEFSRYEGMMEKQSSTLGGKMSNLEDSVSRLQTNFGGNLAVIFGPIVTGLTNFMETINGVSPILSGFVTLLVTATAGFIALQVTGLLPLIVNVPALGIAFQTLTASVGLMATETVTLNGALFLVKTTIQSLMTSIGPLGWAIIAITAIGAAWSLTSKENTSDLKKQAEAQKELEIQNDKAVKDIKKQQLEFERLTNIVKDSNATHIQRKDAIATIQKTYPDFLRNIDIEKLSTAQLTSEIQKYNQALLTKVELQVREKRLAVLKDEELKLNDQKDATEKQQNESKKRQADNAKNGKAGFNFAESKNEEDYGKSLNDINNQLAQVRDKMDKERSAIEKASDTLKPISESIGDEKTRLDKEILELEGKINALPKNDAALQSLSALLHSKQAERKKLDSYTDAVPTNTTTESFSEKVLKILGIATVKGKEDETYKHLLTEITHGTKNYETIKQTVFKSLKENEDKQKFLDDVRKHTEALILSTGGQNQKASTTLLMQVNSDLEQFNGGILNTLESRKKSLEFLKSSAKTNDEIISITKNILAVDREIEAVNNQTLILKKNGSLFDTKVDIEILQKKYEQVKGKEEGVAILRQLLSLQESERLLTEELNSTANIGVKGETKAEERQRLNDAAKFENEKNNPRDKAKVELLNNEIDKQAELEATKIYTAEIAAKKRSDIESKYAKKTVEIQKTAEKEKVGIIQSALNVVAGLFGKQTLVYKMMAIAQATIDAYSAFNLALATIPPPFGEIQAGISLIAGLANVVKIVDVKLPGYARGGAVVGENGPEIIAPMQDYASGQVLLAEKTARAVQIAMQAQPISSFSKNLEAKIDKVFDRLSNLNFKIKGYDLATVNGINSTLQNTTKWG